MEEVTEGFLQQRLETALKPLDVCLCPTGELVDVNASIVSEDESEPDNYVSIRINQSALAQDVCLAIARAFKSEPLRLLRWDFSVIPNDAQFLDLSTLDREVPVDVVLARSSDLIPVTVSVTLSDKDQDGEHVNSSSTKNVDLLFYKNVTLAAVFRIALIYLYKNQDVFSQELEFLDPLKHPIDEPASLTLQQCITRCGFVEPPPGMKSYPFAVNDGLPLKLSYSDGEISSCCTVLLPPSGSTVENVMNNAYCSMNLPGEPKEYFLANSSGFALLDPSEELDRGLVEKGLVISTMDHLMRVYLNNYYMMSFVDNLHPTVAALLDGIGLPETVPVTYNEVMVPSSMPLTSNGIYSVVEESDKKALIKQDILLPSNEHTTVSITEKCTAAQLVEALAVLHPPQARSAESDDEELIPALQDDADCILADNILVRDFADTTLHYCFV